MNLSIGTCVKAYLHTSSLRKIDTQLIATRRAGYARIIYYACTSYERYSGKTLKFIRNYRYLLLEMSF